MNLLVQRLDPQLPLPQYAHPGDAGLDLHSRVDVTLHPGSGRWFPPAWRSRCPPDTQPSSTRAVAWLFAMAWVW